jgi:hypothetical protein
MVAIRDQFFGESSADVLNLKPVYVDESDIIERAQEYLPVGALLPETKRRAEDPLPKTGDFSVGETRKFRVETSKSPTTVYKIIDARLLAQGVHTNIWLLDDYAESRRFSWINESLADIAKVFYTLPDSEINDWGRIRDAAGNSYTSSGYGDFVNFNGSQKNYDMGQMLSRMLHKQTGGLYTHKVFDHFKTKYPPAISITANYSTFI